MVKMKKQLVSSRKNTYGEGNPANYITIHETANYDKGADAQAHANIQSNGYAATWHWTVDDKEAIQSFPHNVRCWHAGDGKGKGNYQSIGVEICVNADGDFKQAVENATELVKKIMKDEGVSTSNVVQHNHWSGKNCPANLRGDSRGISWSDLKKMLGGDGDGDPDPEPDEPINGRLESKVDGLRFYNKPSWKDKDVVGTADKGYGFPTIVRKLKVDSAYQYQVKNSNGATYYITAADKYVKIIDGSTSKPAPKPKRETVTLPAGAKTWRTYKLNVRPVKRNSDWSLTPSRYGGLTYQILGRPYPNVVTINTSRGKRNIYVGPGTGAIIK